jgi:putative membrane protein
VGGMMGSAGGGWILLWTLLAVALVAVGGVVAAWALTTRRGAEPTEIRGGDSPAVREAKDALKLRYAHGEIGREEYLQGKVELED